MNKRIIIVKQTLTYKQEFELTDGELKILEAADDCDICSYTSNETNRQAFEIIEGLIDPNEVFDAEQEYKNFELLKP